MLLFSQDLCIVRDGDTHMVGEMRKKPHIR